MGGAEKLILELAHLATKKEPTRIIDVSPKIANIYGNLILKRSFKSHINDHSLKLENHTSLTPTHFIPLTKKWKETTNFFHTSRTIYLRFELLEIAICLYFGGSDALKKSVAGLFLTPIYSSPRGLVDKLHNIIYGSFLYKFLLSSVSKVHVLNDRDKKLLRTKYGVKNIISLPPAVEFSHIKTQALQRDPQTLEIIYVGELSSRKGVDTIISIIRQSPSHFSFNIVGDGPLKNEILKLQDEKKCKYHGYVSSSKLSSLYDQSDVLLFPSRSESFGMVMAEALAYGAKIVNSSDVTLNLPEFVETTINNRKEMDYIAALSKIFTQKQNNKIDRKKIQQFAKQNYSPEVINARFTKEVLNIKN